MGKTFPNVSYLLRMEFEHKKVTKYSFCKETGINPTSVERYLHGISEPSQATLEKLAEYFTVSVAWLRGETDNRRGMLSLNDTDFTMKIVKDYTDLYNLAPEHLRESILVILQPYIEDLLSILVVETGKESTNETLIREIESILEKSFKCCGIN